MICVNSIFQKLVEASGGLIYLDICTIVLLLVCLVTGVILIIRKKNNEKKFKWAIIYVYIVSFSLVAKIFFIMIKYF